MNDRLNSPIAFHIELLILFLTLIGSIYMMYSSVEAINARTDACIESMNERVDATNARIDSFNERFEQFLITWHEEIKDFHKRLCTIEANREK